MNTTPRSGWSGPARPFHPFGRSLFVLLSTLLLALPVPSLAAPGDLDPSFDGDGSVLTDFRSGRFSDFNFVSALAVQPNGKLVAAGGSLLSGGGVDFVLARYNRDGSLDASFGRGGRVRTNFGDDASLDALVLQPNGKVVVAGTVDRFSGAADFVLARYNRDGSLDASFGNGGLVRTDFGARDRAFELVLQPDGKLVAAGDRIGDIGDRIFDALLARYNPDGSVDMTFGDGGLVVLANQAFGFPGDLVLQPDGKLVLVRGSLVRVNLDGTLDTSFGLNGMVRGRASHVALALQPDGKLTAAGVMAQASSSNDIDADLAVERFNADGSLDMNFGNAGLVVTDFGEDSQAHALVLQPDGKLVAAGEFGIFDFNSGPDFLVVRYLPDGSLDTSFGSGGAVRTEFGRTRSIPAGGGARALVLQADGKVVAAGESDASGDFDFALLRYLTTNERLAVPPKCGGRRATILGTSRNDTIRGTRGRDIILGRGGNDTIRGLEGNDTICGGAGRDTLIGNDGKDRLLGEDGDDKLFGDKGRDRLDGGSGRDACRTGETAQRCEGKPASSKPTSGERPKDPPKPPCPPISNFPCS